MFHQWHASAVGSLLGKKGQIVIVAFSGNSWQYTMQDVCLVFMCCLVGSLVILNAQYYCLYEEFSGLFYMLITLFTTCMACLLLSESLLLSLFM
jgi:NADH:ubiquinone oxidoreductase subunit 5 (subunit L)/multisubunit Na+/H+ antiporter MnhA subunit